MRFVLPLFLMVCVLWLPACESTSPGASGADQPTPAEMASAENVARIEAKGMSCPLCASNADRRLMKIDGVEWTNIDLGNGEVVVGLDPDKPAPSAEALKEAIRDAGFTAESVALPEDEVTP